MKGLGKDINTRITIVNTHGVVVADSEKDRQRMVEAQAAAPAEEKAKYRSLVEDLERSIAGAASALADAQTQYAALSAVVSQRRTHRFELELQQVLHDMLADLLDKLDRLRTEVRVAVEQRLGWARRIGELSRHHPKARVSWAEARASIERADGIVASDLYRGQPIELRDDDMVGLVPIGMNPVTKLWEFYELRSAWDGQFTDPRITHYWDPARVLNAQLLDAVTFDVQLRLYDNFLLYDKKAVWEKRLPRPGYWMHEYKGAPGPWWNISVFSTEVAKGWRGEAFTPPLD